MPKEQMTREEAIQYLTMQRDLLDEVASAAEFKAILSETGSKVGYTPAFRCLVKGQDPEQSIRWGK